jgi:arylsulfatase A-like enzyme
MKKPKYNIVLIILDALRADHLSCYGYLRKTTPNIDKIAKEGVLFKNAFSPAVWTVPSMASIFTGTYPSRHGAVSRHRYLGHELFTLAEVLRDEGYRTIVYSNNPFVSAKETGLARGFDIVKGLDYHLRGIKTICWKVFEIVRGIKDNGAYYTNKYIKQWLRKHYLNDFPFFLLIHYLETHAPYKWIPKPYRTAYLENGLGFADIKKVNQDYQKYLVGTIEMKEHDFQILNALYDAEIAYLDFRVNEIFNLLKEMEILDDTLLIITSDHGENIGDHNLMHHAYCLYDTLLKVPLIIRCPEVFPPSSVNFELVSTLDIFPTLMDILNIERKEVKNQLQGKVLVPGKLVQDATEFLFAELDRPINEFKDRYPEFDFSVYDRELKSVRTKEYKFIWSSDGKHELYNVMTDPGETCNLIEKEYDTALKLQEIIFEWFNSFPKPDKEEDTPEINARIKKQLEGLGYF